MEAMAGISMSHGELDAFVENANGVIMFKLVRKKEDLEDESCDFPPEYSHQIFGNSELIFGYNGLKVSLYYTASRLLPVFNMTYKSVYKNKKKEDLAADDVYKIITDKLEMTIPTNIDQFVASLEKEVSFRPHGKLIHSCQVENGSGSKDTFEVYRCVIDTPGFKEYRKRVESFILWFIDAASFIDADDDRWEFFQMYERVVENGDPRFYFVGFCNVYRYYAYPLHVRPRISQMLILPPFQKRGLGVELLQSIYNWQVSDFDVLDITVEDPSEEFIRLRDYVDCKNCIKLKSFQKEKLLKGYDPDMHMEARKRFKICKRQSRRVYEILRLRVTNIADDNEYRKYRLDVKQRLNAPFQRQKLDIEKMKNALSTEELAATKLPLEQRIEQLEHTYKELEQEYKKVIERLSLST